VEFGGPATELVAANGGCESGSCRKRYGSFCQRKRPFPSGAAKESKRPSAEVPCSRLNVADRPPSGSSQFSWRWSASRPIRTSRRCLARLRSRRPVSTTGHIDRRGRKRIPRRYASHLLGSIGEADGTAIRHFYYRRLQVSFIESSAAFSKVGNLIVTLRRAYHVC
jgi:hypothetical protein